jgi:hypothetical protein
MSRKTDSAPTIQPGQDAAGQSVHNASAVGPEHDRRGILRRWRTETARVHTVDSCPSCGLTIRDKSAARLGFCDRCREFTGMCGAGRRVICPDVMTRTTWHSPCTELGAAAWEIDLGQGAARTVLCKEHDAQLRFGSTPWIVEAAPLVPPSGEPPRQAGRLKALRK